MASSSRSRSPIAFSGQLVGARRPTVSTALSELAEREELTRRPDGSWLLRGDPPDAESLARKPGPAGQSARPQDLMRPARSFEREPSEPEVVTAIERLREALSPDNCASCWTGAAASPRAARTRA